MDSKPACESGLKSLTVNIGLRVNYQLAFKTKRQGDAQDYRVLARSEGPLSIEDFETVFNRLSVGTMPSKAIYDGEKPPWVTFGSVKTNQVTYIAAIRQEWTDLTDARSRPVAAMCCLCFPYTELAESRPTYATIYRGIPHLSAFLNAKGILTDDASLFIQPEKQWQEVARVIDEVGFEYCASVASLLVSTPVAIVKGISLKVEERLSFLDAITGLLPYGARADLHASTWMYSASSSTTRLGFTEAARQEQQRVAWGEESDHILSTDSESKGYYQLLMNIRERHSTREIVKSLASQVNPIKFGSQTTFINALRATDRLNLLWQDLKDGQVRAADVRSAFREEVVTELPDNKKAALLLTLFQDLEPQDFKLLRQHWSRQLEAPLCTVIVSAPEDPGFPSGTLLSLYDLAVEKNWLAQYLEALLQSTLNDTMAKAGALDLLYMGLSELNGDHNAEDAKRIRAKLILHRRLLYEFAFIVLQHSAEGVKSWFKWLAGNNQSVTSDLDTFAIAAGLKKRDASLQQIRRIGESSSQLVPRLIRLAANVSDEAQDLSILGRIIPSATVWLLESFDSLNKAARDEWRLLLPVIKNTPVKTDLDDARVDVLYLALSTGDVGLLLETYLRGPLNPFRSYSHKLLGLLDCLGDTKQRAIEDLIAYCSSLDFRLIENNDNLLHFYSELVAHTKSERAQEKLAEAIEMLLNIEPDLLSRPTFTPRLRNYLVEGKRSSGLFKAFESKLKKQLSSKVAVSEIANIVVDLLSLHSIDKELKVIKILDNQKFLSAPQQIEEFIEALKLQFARRYPYGSEAHEQTIYFHKALLKYDSYWTDDYRQYLGTRLLNELRKIAIMAELVGDELNENQAEEVSLQLDKVYNRLKRDGFLKGLTFWPTKKK
jgi:hypothetical protein